VSSRSYLSIGDVLTLLREEFPDVTISKIRFLESQGLVNPERSPSGYRKFFEHDVERLRWVLRQQREHFLPLKVIRDRLADGDLDDETVPSGGHANGKPAEPAHAAAATPTAAAAAMGPGTAPPPRTDEQSAKRDDEAMARILADASRRTAQMPEAVQARRPETEDAGAERPATHGATEAPARSGPSTGAPATRGATSGGPVAHAAAAGGDATAGKSGDAAAPPAVAAAAAGGASASASANADKGRATQPGAGGGRPAAPQVPAAAPTPTPAAATAIVTGASLTAEELCSACGLSKEELAGLEGFGLIESVHVAGIATYDEEALAVANLAVAFRAYGIEPRHLRLYRNAVDREMGLIEQVVIPLLRQRNPESRQRAVEGADQLAALGQSMRGSLLRVALRRHLGG
jgi:DNA-binding transcriptional MerR regulator